MTRQELAEKAYALGIDDYVTLKDRVYCGYADHLINSLKSFSKLHRVKLEDVMVEFNKDSALFEAYKDKTAKELKEEIEIVEEKEYEKFLELRDKYEEKFQAEELSPCCLSTEKKEEE